MMTEIELDGRYDFEIHVNTQVEQMVSGSNSDEKKKLLKELIMTSFDNGVRLGHGKKIYVKVR